jgi:hypothetical protein
VGGGRQKGDKKVNMVQKCVHIYVNAKMIPVETSPGIRGGEDKRERERVILNMMYLTH